MVPCVLGGLWGVLLSCATIHRTGRQRRHRSRHCRIHRASRRAALHHDVPCSTATHRTQRRPGTAVLRFTSRSHARRGGTAALLRAARRAPLRPRTIPQLRRTYPLLPERCRDAPEPCSGSQGSVRQVAPPAEPVQCPAPRFITGWGRAGLTGEWVLLGWGHGCCGTARQLPGPHFPAPIPSPPFSPGFCRHRVSLGSCGLLGVPGLSLAILPPRSAPAMALLAQQTPKYKHNLYCTQRWVFFHRKRY